MTRRANPAPASNEPTDGVAYLRVSTREQERDGFSIDAQRRLLREYAERNRIKIVAEFVDVETARTTGRKQFGEMLRFVSRNKCVRAILVEKTDRLNRNLADWVKIDDLDVELHLVKEGDVITKNARASEKFMYGVRTLMAKQYCDNLSEEARKGMLEKAEQSLWPSAAPVGYRNVIGPHNKKVIEPDPCTAPTVKRLFDWYAEGDLSVKDLVSLARSEGLSLSKSGSRINASKVHQVLRRRLYCGDFDWKGRVYKGTHEPLVSRDLWDHVQVTPALASEGYLQAG